MGPSPDPLGRPPGRQSCTISAARSARCRGLDVERGAPMARQAARRGGARPVCRGLDRESSSPGFASKVPSGAVPVSQRDHHRVACDGRSDEPEGVLAGRPPGDMGRPDRRRAGHEPFLLRQVSLVICHRDPDRLRRSCRDPAGQRRAPGAGATGWQWPACPRRPPTSATPPTRRRRGARRSRRCCQRPAPAPTGRR
jgi:hypothetical protein